jgi:hypothetical protein
VTISSSINKHVYEGNGVTVLWPYSFEIHELSDIKVYLTDPNGVTILIEENYEVKTVSQEVEYPTAASHLDPLPEGWKITVLREMPLTQEVDLQNQGDFNAEVLEASLDKLTMMMQQLKEQLSRAVKYPVAQNPSSEEVGDILTIIANKIATMEADILATVAGPVSEAEGSAVAAAGSAAAAQGSAGSAALSEVAAQNASGEAAASAAAAAESASHVDEVLIEGIPDGGIIENKLGVAASYNVPVERHMVVPAAAFNASNGGSFALGNTGGEIYSSSVGNIYLLAPVILPQGAVVDEIKYYIYRNTDISNDISGGMYSSPVLGGSGSVVGSSQFLKNDTTDTGWQCLTKSGINHAVDNTANKLSLMIALEPGSLNTDVRLSCVVIKYKVTKPLP